MIDDAVLGILKWALLALLYLFFARVLWAVWSEVRQPKGRADQGQHAAANSGPPAIAAPHDPTVIAGANVPAIGAAAAASGPMLRPAQSGFGAPGQVAANPGNPGAAGTNAAGPANVKPRVVKGKKGNVGRVVVTEPKARRGSAWPVEREITIGRAVTCTIAMPDDTFVSQLHARIYRDGPTVWVEDLGSTNGSYLNGQRLDRPIQVALGDRMQFGNTTLEAQ